MIVPIYLADRESRLKQPDGSAIHLGRRESVYSFAPVADSVEETPQWVIETLRGTEPHYEILAPEGSEMFTSARGVLLLRTPGCRAVDPQSAITYAKSRAFGLSMIRRGDRRFPPPAILPLPAVIPARPPRPEGAGRGEPGQGMLF